MRNYAFIDSQNMNLAIRSLGWRIDFKRLRVYLKDKYCIEKAYLFIGYIDGNNALYSKLQDAGFICIFKPTLVGKNRTVKGNVDAELVLHTMIQLHNYDMALIITGDGDFYCLIQYLIEHSKLLTVLIPNQNKYSALIKRFAKKNISFMNDLREKICDEYK